MSTLTREGCDASYDLPTATQLAAAGRPVIGRYITDPGPGNKGITQAEVDDYSRHSVVFFLVWELGANAALQGYAQGAADAKRAQHNLAALKGPSSKRPIYFAVDFDAQPAQYAAIAQYFKGVASVIGRNRTGAYGSYAVLRYLSAGKLVTFLWQTYAWSGGKVLDGIHVLQYRNGQSLGSGTVDYCRAIGSGNFGQKTIVLAKPAPAKQPGPAKPDPHVIYTVRSDDTLGKIADRFNTSVPAIVKLNASTIHDPNLIYPGQKVRVK